ncbi:MAG: hypothetical protein J6X60_12470 [Ruminiclostridium sp.]|nr:hypothetical protein [Ruminiclostridium sp.]
MLFANQPRKNCYSDSSRSRPCHRLRYISSPTWKFKIDAAPSLREGIEYYVGSIIETADGDILGS